MVRVHTDKEAAESARAVSGAAYTVGRHIVFGAGLYAPATPEGGRLLAHELTHVVQQAGIEPTLGEIPVGNAGGANEREADRVSADVVRGGSVTNVRGGFSPVVARSSDTGHHVIEEAALSGAGFSDSQRRAIERGNVERDYSQVGVVGNAILLCRPHDFGGYKAEEHFDNYIWDEVTKGWRTRGASALGERNVDVGMTPIDYIGGQLDEVVRQGMSDGGLTALGNAFHTVEDFFAHSNFVELVQGDTARGAALMTGNLAGKSQAVPRILEAITPRGIQEHYGREAESAIAEAPPGSHTEMAHDDPTTPNYTLARRLAALVVQDLGREVLAVMAAPAPERTSFMRERVVAKVRRYLRPPNPDDKWWETLTSADAGRIDRRLDEAAMKTPTTVNQCALSPLKNLEASRNSPMALPFGVAIPTVIGTNQVWFQIGAGVMRPFPLGPLPDASPVDRRGGAGVIGAQITGTF